MRFRTEEKPPGHVIRLTAIIVLLIIKAKLCVLKGADRRILRLNDPRNQKKASKSPYFT